jgi:hypothetical protein
MEDDNEIEKQENSNISTAILSGLEHVATILGIKKKP